MKKILINIYVFINKALSVFGYRLSSYKKPVFKKINPVQVLYLDNKAVQLFVSIQPCNTRVNNYFVSNKIIGVYELAVKKYLSTGNLDSIKEVLKKFSQLTQVHTANESLGLSQADNVFTDFALPFMLFGHGKLEQKMNFIMGAKAV